MDNHSAGLTAEEIRDLVGEAPLMLEIGSHDGSDTLKFLAAMPDILLYCFEPDQRPIARFEAAIENDPRVSLTQAAVSDRNGKAILYRSSGVPLEKRWEGVTDWDYSNSLFRPTGHLKMSPWCTFPESRQLEVSTVRLDTWLRKHPEISTIDFIWADTQGGEAVLIQGATETLKRTRWLYTEYYDTPMYAGQPNLNTIASMLPGWELMATYSDNALFRQRHWEA